MVLTRFIEGLHDAQHGWELRKSKPASPDAALALAVELHAFMKWIPVSEVGPQATIDMVSTTPPQRLTTTTSSSREDMMGTLIQTFRQKIHRTLSQTNQNASKSRFCSTDGHCVRFNSAGPNRESANTNPN